MEQPQVLVRFIKGDNAYFNIQGLEEFLRLKDELEKISCDWIKVGTHAFLNKSQLEGFYYYPQGVLHMENKNVER